MKARVEVQSCGCIALSDDLAAALKIGPGSVLEVEMRPDGSATITRTSEPMAVADAPLAAPCPIP